MDNQQDNVTNRRSFLSNLSTSFGGLALGSLLARDGLSADPAAAARARAAAEACFSSTDFAEGRDAFLAKRTPRFEGR